MTNLQRAQEERDAGLPPAMLRRLWFWAPIAAGGALTALLLSAVAVPQWLAIRGDQERLSALEDRRQEADMLKLQTVKVVKERREAQRQQEQLIQLVAGPAGDGATFLATLDLEARQAGVKLQLFEPTAAAAAAAGEDGAPGAPKPGGAPPARAGGNDKVPPPPPDPMKQAGLEKRSLLLSARGTYPQLLAFLRRMEQLDVLVEQSELSLGVAGIDPNRPKANEKEVPPQVPEVEAKVSLTLYSKAPAAAKAPPEKPKPPTTPGAPG